MSSSIICEGKSPSRAAPCPPRVPAHALPDKNGRLGPLGREPAVQVEGAIGPQARGKLMELVARHPMPEHRRQHRSQALEPAVPRVGRDGGKAPCHHPPRRTRDRPHRVCHTRPAQTCRLYPANSSSPPSPESATVTSPASQLRDKKRGDLRRVGERLVVHRSQPGHHVQRLGRGDVQLGVVGAQVRGDGGGVSGLVESRIRRADRERPDGAVALGLHERHDRRGVHAAGEEGAERDVGEHPQPYGIAEQGLQSSTASSGSR